MEETLSLAYNGFIRELLDEVQMLRWRARQMDMQMANQLESRREAPVEAADETADPLEALPRLALPPSLPPTPAELAELEEAIWEPISAESGARSGGEESLNKEEEPQVQSPPAPQMEQTSPRREWIEMDAANEEASAGTVTGAVPLAGRRSVERRWSVELRDEELDERPTAKDAVGAAARASMLPMALAMD